MDKRYKYKTGNLKASRRKLRTYFKINCTNNFWNLSSKPKETNRWDLVKLKSSAQQIKSSTKWKNNLTNGRGYFQMIWPIRCQYPNYINDS